MRRIIHPCFSGIGCALLTSTLYLALATAGSSLRRYSVEALMSYQPPSWKSIDRLVVVIDRDDAADDAGETLQLRPFGVDLDVLIRPFAFQRFIQRNSAVSTDIFSQMR